MSDINSNQNITENDSVQEENDEFVKNEQIKQMLEEAGILNYDPQVVTHLSDYINYYAIEVLDQASIFTKHAGRETINLADMKLAIDVTAKKSSKRLSQKELIKMAHEHNKSQLPECSGGGYLPLPTDGCVLTKCNYKLRPTNPQIPMNIPFMDMTNRQNTVMSLNTIKNHPGGIPTVFRTSSGPMSLNVPMNLNPQRIILKPQTPMSNNLMYTTLNKIDENAMKKRMKYEEYRK